MSSSVKHFGVTYLWLAACMVLMAACSSREALRSMERAEQLLDDAPEEALRVMEGVDSEALRTEEDRARYALVYSEAC